MIFIFGQFSNNGYSLFIFGQYSNNKYIHIYMLTKLIFVKHCCIKYENACSVENAIPEMQLLCLKWRKYFEKSFNNNNNTSWG